MSTSTAPATLMAGIFAKAKADADGGLVLFGIGDYHVALGEDAEAVADALGVELQKQPARAGRKNSEKQILLRARHLQRNLRFLLAAGHEVWIADQNPAAEPVATLISEELAA